MSLREKTVNNKEAKATFALLKKLIISNCDFDVFRSKLNSALENGYEIDYRGDGFDADGIMTRESTLFKFAVRSNRPDIARLLLNSGAYIDIPQIINDIAYLGSYIMNQSEKKLQELVDQITPIFDYCYNLDEDSRQKLFALKNKYNQSFQDVLNNALSDGIKINNQKYRMWFAKRFFELGAEVTEQTWKNLLHNPFPSPTIKKYASSSPVDIIDFSDFQDAFDFLLEAGGVHMSAPDYSEAPILSYIVKEIIHENISPFGGRSRRSLNAVSSEREDVDEYTSRMLRYVIQRFVEEGCDLNQQDRDGRTVLHEACSGVKSNYRDNVVAWGIDTVKQLITGGARIDIKDIYGNTPLMYLKIMDWGATREQLEKLAADTEQHINAQWLAREYEEAEFTR